MVLRYYTIFVAEIWFCQVSGVRKVTQSHILTDMSTQRKIIGMKEGFIINISTIPSKLKPL